MESRRMSLMRRLARHAQRLCNLLPGPSLVNRTLHCLTLHPIRKSPEADDRRDRGSRVIEWSWHTSTIRR